MVRILVVDINATTSYRIKKLLQTFDVEIFHASNTTETINKINNPQVEIDLVISDAQLGAEDGLELIKRVKENHPQIMAMIITSLNTRKAFVQSIKIGATDYVIKPYEENYLKNKLIHHIKSIEKSKTLPNYTPREIDNSIFNALKKAVREDYEIMIGLLVVFHRKEMRRDGTEVKDAAILKALINHLSEILHADDECKMQNSNGLILILPKRAFALKTEVAQTIEKTCDDFIHKNKLRDTFINIEFISLPNEVDPKQNAISVLAERIEKKSLD